MAMRAQVDNLRDTASETGTVMYLPAQKVTEIPATLCRWYAAHSPIRRLWALEDRDELIVFVTLEPTPDGDDTLPVWLTKSRDWANDLRARTNREVQLKLIVSGVFEKSYVNADAAMIVELSWRDSWTSA
jgi:hypothetical protein